MNIISKRLTISLFFSENITAQNNCSTHDIDQIIGDSFKEEKFLTIWRAFYILSHPILGRAKQLKEKK
jgi:hypothetical protein